ncbi:hypothetical protein [Aeromonas veronii]|uniref:hypothetical protein n=1 Tax=Aeromonas veronii TaxID=654 RepID=UPI0038F20442
MSEPEPRCRRAGAGLATGFVWNGSLPVELVAVGVGLWLMSKPEPRCRRAGAGLATRRLVLETPVCWWLSQWDIGPMSVPG